MKRNLTQQLIISILFTLLSLTSGQLWAADALHPIKITSPNAPFTVAPSGGNSALDIKQKNFTTIVLGNAWFTPHPEHSNSLLWRFLYAHTYGNLLPN